MRSIDFLNLTFTWFFFISSITRWVCVCVCKSMEENHMQSYLSTFSQEYFFFLLLLFRYLDEPLGTLGPGEEMKKEIGNCVLPVNSKLIFRCNSLWWRWNLFNQFHSFTTHCLLLFSLCVFVCVYVVNNFWSEVITQVK